MSSTSEYKGGCLLGSFDFQKSVVMSFLLLASRTEVEIFTYATFIADTNYGKTITAITTDSFVYSILWFLLWLFLFHLWFLIFFKYDTFSYLINYLRKHTTHNGANKIYFFTDIFFLMSFPLSSAFFFYFTMINNDWVAFWINC